MTQTGLFVNWSPQCPLTCHESLTHPENRRKKIYVEHEDVFWRGLREPLELIRKFFCLLKKYFLGCAVRTMEWYRVHRRRRIGDGRYVVAAYSKWDNKLNFIAIVEPGDSDSVVLSVDLVPT